MSSTFQSFAIKSHKKSPLQQDTGFDKNLTNR